MQEVARTAVGTDAYGTYYLILSKEVVSQSIASNYSLTKIQISLSCPVWISFSSATLKITSSTGDIGTVQLATSYGAGTHVLWNNGDGWTLGHDDKGVLDYAISAYIHTTYLLDGTVSGKITAPDIPRYTTASQSLNSKTETTIKMNWNTTDTVDYVWYSINNGSTWVAVGSVNATSGTYTISGLSANTTYNIKTRVRRKDSQLTSDTTNLSVTTYKVPTNSYSSLTETSVTISWTCDTNIDHLWYSINNGSSWVDVGAKSGTSGSYTISGLSPNTSYNIKTRVRRSATQTTYDCATIGIKTYAYPYITAVGTTNLIIGNSQKLTLYNPLKRNVIIMMNKNNASGAQLYYGTTTEATIQFTPNALTLYNSIPNSKSGKCVYSCFYSSNITTSQYEYKVNEDLCIPTFNDFAYADTSSMTSLTSNNQLLVNGYSTCTFTVSTTNKALAKNGASITKYKFEWGSKSSEANYSSSANVSSSIVGSTTGVLKVTAIDSRGLSKTVTKNITAIAYVNATMNSLATQRKNGVDVETYLSFNATLWNGNWNASSNSNYANRLKYVGYRVHNGSSWTSYFDITAAVKNAIITSATGNIITLNLPFSKNIAIHADGSSGGFEIGKAYKIQVYIRDGTSNITFNPSTYYATLQADVTDGKVGLSRYKDSNGDYHYGINGMPLDDYLIAVNGIGVLKMIDI